MRRSLIVFIAAVMAFVAVLIWFATAAPDQVPGHISASGEIDWDSRGSFLTAMGIGGFGVIALFVGLALLLPRLPARLINLPSKRAHAYWTSPEHRPELNRVLITSMDFMGAAVALLFTGIVVTMGLKALGTEVPTWAFLLPVILMLGTILASIIWLFIRTRVPRGLPPQMPRGRGERPGA